VHDPSAALAASVDWRALASAGIDPDDLAIYSQVAEAYCHY
jgi:hypothetical protein